MIIKRGSHIKTAFLSGEVIEIIYGKDRNGWKDTLYFWVKVDRMRVKPQIVRLDEIREVSDDKVYRPTRI